MKIIEYLILLFPLLWELVTDYYRIEIKKKNDNHTEDVWVRIGLCVLVGIACRYWFGQNAIQGFLYSGAMFITFFDYVLNIARKKNIFHKGNNTTDKFLSHLPLHAEVFARLWVFGVGYSFYYHWNLIFPR